MGTADIIPGISGGTVALILGIYDRLVSNISRVDFGLIKNIMTGRFSLVKEQIEFGFLFRLFSGIFLAVMALARLLSFVLSEYPHYTWSFFFGLILFSSLSMFIEIKRSYFQKLPLFGLGAIIAYFIVKLTPVEFGESSLHLLGAGSIASMAMILPGISGSFMLLILGKYQYILSAVKNPFQLESIIVLIPFVLGVGLGLILFSKILNWAIEKYRDGILGLLTGFMFGSLVKVWPWRKIEDVKFVSGKLRVISDREILPVIDAALIGCIGLMLLGALLVYLVGRQQNQSLEGAR
jgi:putative membrane protein